MQYSWKVLWSRRRTKKPNKLVSISKYQSYHRHHLIRISSCHKLQLRAKKTKKNEFFSIPIETANYEKKNLHTNRKSITRPSRCSMHSILLESGAPSLKNCSWKIQDRGRGGKKKKNNNIANFYVTRNIILQSASCFQHFLLSNIILFPNQYISIYVSTFIILRQNLCYMLYVVCQFWSCPSI